MARKRRLLRAVGRVANATHARIYRRSDGRRGGMVKGIPVLLLTTTGRRSGQARTVPICFCRDGDGIVVAGTNGGMKHAPSWSLNLRAEPLARIQLGGTTFDVQATEAIGAEYDRLWSSYVAQHPAIGPYATKTTRHIALWQLEPVPAHAAAAAAAVAARTAAATG